MRIFGVDPGTVVIGYGVVDGRHDELVAVAYGAIKCKERQPLPERLAYLFDELNRLLDEHQPDVLAVETPFVAENVKSALAIGKAQAVAMLAAARRHIPVFEYTPTAIKSHVADYGASSKEQIQDMVKFLLGLDEVPQPNDAADALAVAICHSREARLREIMAEGE